jgi:hypothetical protein
MYTILLLNEEAPLTFLLWLVGLPLLTVYFGLLWSLLTFLL